MQAVFEEERDDSKLKLILCGSLIGQMEALQSERSPLHGRLIPLQLHALPFGQASVFLRELAEATPRGSSVHCLNGLGCGGEAAARAGLAAPARSAPDAPLLAAQQSMA